MQNTQSQVLEALQWRYATKRFDPEQKISESDLAELLEALRLSASSYGIQPYRFILVKDEALRQQLRTASMGQSQITDASHMLVFAAKKRFSEADTEAYMKLIAETRGIPRSSLDGFAAGINGRLQRASPEELEEWAARQAYIAVGNLLTAAALKRIDACPMEGLNPAQYDQILSLDSLGLSTKVVVTLGYRSEEDALAHMAKVRLPHTELFIER